MASCLPLLLVIEAESHLGQFCRVKPRATMRKRGGAILKVSHHESRQYACRCCLLVSHRLCRRPPIWTTLDELLDKLLFVTVSDDGAYSKSFVFWTYLTLSISRPYVYLSLPSDVPTLRCPLQCFACHAKTYASAGRAVL